MAAWQDKVATCVRGPDSEKQNRIKNHKLRECYIYLEVKLHYNSYTEIMQMIHYLLRREDDHDT